MDSPLHYSGPCHCANLRHASRSISQVYDRFLEPTGLKITQYALLRQVGRLGPVSMTGLAKSMGLDRTTLVRNSKPMEERGLISSTQGRNQRVHELCITDQGSKVLEAATAHWEAAQKQIESYLGQDKLDTLLGLLQQLQAMPDREEQ